MMAAVDLPKAKFHFNCNVFPCLEVKIAKIQNLVIIRFFQAEKLCHDFSMEVVTKQDLRVQGLLRFFYTLYSTRERLPIAAASRH